MRLSRREFTVGCGASILPVSARSHQSPADHYDGQLILKALPGRLMEVQSRFGYTEGPGRQWTVPPGAIVDGASIPRVFWSITGGPWDGSYREASVIHDWYCAVRIQPWQDTHAMFYHAMLRSGVGTKLARLMYLAVYYAGPSWDDLTIANNRILTRNGATRLLNDKPRSRERYAFDENLNFGTPRNAAEAAAVDRFQTAQTDTAVLRANLKEFADASEANGFDIAEMNGLIDRHGRDEVTAEALAKSGSG